MTALVATLEDGRRREDLVAEMAQTGVGQVLVVGCRGDNFPVAYRQHDQLLFWEGDDAIRKDVPKGVTLVVVTRFLQHTGYGRLRSQCMANGVAFAPQTLGTGEIKLLLAPFFPAPEARAAGPAEVVTSPARTVGDQARGFGYGQLQTFVQANGDPFKSPYKLEARRLEALAQEMGFVTTEDAVAKTMARLRGFIAAQEDLGRVLALSPEAEEEEPVKAVATAAAQPEPVAPVVSSTARGNGLDDDATIIRMLDDITAAVTLVRETIVKRGRKRAELKKLLEEV